MSDRKTYREFRNEGVTVVDLSPQHTSSETCFDRTLDLNRERHFMTSSPYIGFQTAVRTVYTIHM